MSSGDYGAVGLLGLGGLLAKPKKGDPGAPGLPGAPGIALIGKTQIALANPAFINGAVGRSQQQAVAVPAAPVGATHAILNIEGQSPSATFESASVDSRLFLPVSGFPGNVSVTWTAFDAGPIAPGVTTAGLEVNWVALG